MPLQLVAGYDECTFNANDRTYITAGIMLVRMLGALWYWNSCVTCAVKVSTY